MSSGDQWLSRTPEERQLYVSGFLEGSSSASSELCHDFEQNLAGLKFRSGIVVTDQPCLQFRHEYSHSSAGSLLVFTSAYVSVIDDFYKHPECRVMPYSVILEHLDDKEYMSGEDLYKFVRSGHAAWGFFSGLDEMDKCYGVDRKR